MIIRCARCRAEITGEYKFRVEDGKAFCMTHTTDCAQPARSATHTTSWAEDNKVEAAAPAVERSK
jgi:hypothetical protein